MARKPCPGVPSRNASAWSNSITQVGEPWMPSFVSTRATRTPFAPSVGQHRRAEHQAEAVGRALRLLVGRGVARQHQVDVRAAVGDEDLLAVDEVAVALAGRARDDAAQVRAGLRLGQVHAALQLARDEARQVALP